MYGFMVKNVPCFPERAPSAMLIFTARKRSLGQGNVLHLCVILFMVGGLASQHALGGGVGFPACTGKVGLASLHALGRGVGFPACTGKEVGFPACTRTGKSGRYASYWNAFLFLLVCDPAF